MAENYLIRHHCAAGDSVVLSGLIRDLKIARPSCKIAVDTSFKDVWLHNPHVVPAKDLTGAKTVRANYGKYIVRCGRGEPIHFLKSFLLDFQEQTGIHVPLTFPAPDLHLSPAEKHRLPGLPDRYWVVVAGGKTDFTAKIARQADVQASVDILAAMKIRCVQAGSLTQGKPANVHKTLSNVVDRLGKTKLREFFQLIAYSEGVLCGVTSAMHIAAAFGKPAVIWAGGREEVVWEAYYRGNPGLDPVGHLLPVDQRFLHTVGHYDCSLEKGCWKSKVTKADGGTTHCKKPVHTAEEQWVPKCLFEIGPERIVESVLSYYADGTLPPV